MTPAQQFIAQCSNLAQRLGLKFVVVGVRNADGTATVVASPGAVEDLREPVAAKFSLSLAGTDEADAETGWL
jgi:hypothetical protein